jgi:hypothetical protein
MTVDEMTSDHSTAKGSTADHGAANGSAANQSTASGGATAEGVAAGSTGTVPVACSLPRAGLAAQTARWVRLAARAMMRRTQTDDGLRIWFCPEPGAERELRRLVALENQCCPWATWTVQASSGHLVLDVRSSEDGVTVLHGMFAGLWPEPPAGTGDNALVGKSGLPD